MKYSKNKALGMLLGGHCGDSLGATLEFKSEDSTLSHTEIIGGGVFAWQPGDATDDTDLTIIVLQSIQNGIFDENICKQELINWLATNPKDVGNTTRRGIEQLMLNQRPVPTDYGQGNGSMMRSAPLALLDYSVLNFNDVVQTQCSLTHPHINCIVGDRIYVKLLMMALNNVNKIQIYQEALTLSKSNIPLHNMIKNIPQITWNELKTSGYCFDSLVCSLWSLYHFESFEQALIQIVNKGDDSDTSGAITGSLCGAYYGLDAIPKRWLDTLKKKDLIEKLAQKFIA